MLTFSKAASLEFKTRAWKLVPEYAGFIKITTFHGFCFQLLGLLGNLEKSENVIGQCIEAIKSEEIDVASIVNKSVLLLDEFQDVNVQEWQLIQTIIKVAGNIRVIAVGDDDQNIYEFRGSSNAYMKKFATEYEATTYSLVKNYRSASNIVQFNNEWLKTIPNRLKSENLEAVRKEDSNRISLIKYNARYLQKPLVDQLTKDNLKGTRAVLVRTNDEALMINTFLKDAGQRTKLVTGIEGFSLDHLFELRTFTDYLTSNKNDSGLILKKVWGDAKRHFHTIHEESAHYNLCKEVILKFEKAFHNQMLLVEWYDYIREIRIEDVVNGDTDLIIVSTMHKSKGKEFDHVYLLLNNYSIDSAEAKRLFYVACSRAKLNLQIHANVSYFDRMDSSLVAFNTYDGEIIPPDHFEIILGHKDINLGSQKFSRNIIRTLQTGDDLKLGRVKFGNNDALGLDRIDGGNVLVFSRMFNDKKYDKFKIKGFELVSSSVEYLAYWYNSDDDKEYKIVLPKVRFEKLDK